MCVVSFVRADCPGEFDELSTQRKVFANWQNPWRNRVKLFYFFTDGGSYAMILMNSWKSIVLELSASI